MSKHKYMAFIKIGKGQGKQFNSAVKNGAIVLFYSNNCGHCTAMKPQWDALEKVKLSGCNVVSVDAAAAGELDDKWKEHTNSVPTIIAINPSGDKVNFTGDRTTEGFVKFMKESCHSKKLVATPHPAAAAAASHKNKKARASGEPLIYKAMRANNTKHRVMGGGGARSSTRKKKITRRRRHNKKRKSRKRTSRKRSSRKRKSRK